MNLLSHPTEAASPTRFTDYPDGTFLRDDDNFPLYHNNMTLEQKTHCQNALLTTHRTGKARIVDPLFMQKFFPETTLAFSIAMSQTMYRHYILESRTINPEQPPRISTPLCIIYYMKPDFTTWLDSAISVPINLYSELYVFRSQAFMNSYDLSTTGYKIVKPLNQQVETYVTSPLNHLIIPDNINKNFGMHSHQTWSCHKSTADIITNTWLIALHKLIKKYNPENTDEYTNMETLHFMF